MLTYQEKAINRLKAKVNDVNGCWEFTGQRNESGYGRIWYIDKMVAAHRLSIQLIKGENPEGLMVLHTCDNTCCINPDHLYLGDAKQNAKDAVERNRYKPVTGQEHHNSKLTDEQRQEIKSKHGPHLSTKKRNEPGLTYKQVGQLYNVDHVVIQRLIEQYKKENEK